MNETPAPVVVALPGDLHLTEAGRDNHRTAEWAVAEINDLLQPDFVQFVGDNVQHATDGQFRLFLDLARRLQVPWYALVGDHDVEGDPEAEAFRVHVGEPRGALALRGFRFIRLNTQEARPAGLSDRQLAWFRFELEAARAVGERVVLFQHNYPYKVWESFAGPGLDEWRQTVQAHRITAIFAGHTHYGQTANDGRNVAVAVRSIGDPEGGPPGYAVVYLHGEDLAVTYRSRADTGPLLLITHPRARLLATGPEHVVRGADHIRVRAWSRIELAPLEARIDDGAWFALQPCGNGQWTGPLAGEHLAKGEHRLAVRTQDGVSSAAQELIFAVDRTGRYTAVPGVWPPVAGTAFC